MLEASKMTVERRLKLARHRLPSLWESDEFRRFHYRALLWGDLSWWLYDPLIEKLGDDCELCPLIGATARLHAFACNDLRILCELVVKYPEPTEPFGPLPGKSPGEDLMPREYRERPSAARAKASP